MIQFDCPKCLKQINAQDPQAGKTIPCPKCEAEIQVPAAPTIFDDLFDGDDLIVTSAPTDDLDTTDESKSQLSESKERSGDANVHAPSDENDSDQSSDEYEDLQFPDTPDPQEAAAKPLAKKLDPAKEPEEATKDRRGKQQPSAQPAATQPLLETFAIKCPVCDSHLFVTTAKVGTKAKCGDCFSEIDVPEPTAKQLETFAKKQSNEAKAEKTKPPADDDELKLRDAEPIEVDSTFGLAPVEEDLLTPINSVRPFDSRLTSEDFDDDLTLDPVPDFGSTSSEENLTDAESESVDEEPISPYRSRSAQVAERNKRRKKKEANSSPSAQSNRTTKLGFPEFEFESLFNAAVNLVTDSKVIVRCVVTAVLIAAGNVVCHTTLASYYALAEPTMGDSAVAGFWRFGVGWALYGIGTVLLWYFAGVIFRKAADGQREIDSWSVGPSTEWASTFLLTSFSFAVAASPMLMTGAICLIVPVQFFLALPMLLAVWFTQSPFQVIAVDAFANYRRQRMQWRAVWLVVLTLASIGFTSGLLLMIPIPYLNVLTSLAGGMLLSLATLGYAAVAGWHSGKVVEELN